VAWACGVEALVGGGASEVVGAAAVVVEVVDDVDDEVDGAATVVTVRSERAEPLPHPAARTPAPTTPTILARNLFEITSL